MPRLALARRDGCYVANYIASPLTPLLAGEGNWGGAVPVVNLSNRCPMRADVLLPSL